MTRRFVPICLLVAGLVGGCTADSADSPAPAIGSTAASAVASAPPSSASPSTAVPTSSTSTSPAPSVTRSASAATRVSVTTAEVAGVRMGTAAADAERALRAKLGPPRVEKIAECTYEKGRTLHWDTLEVILSDGAEGGAVTLYGWAVKPGRSRFTYALPYGVAVGTPTRQAVRTIPGGTGMAPEEGPYTGSYVVSTPRAEGLLWLSDNPNGRGVIDYIAYRSHTCD